MMLNIFEGARRIALVTQFAIGLFCVVLAASRWPESDAPGRVAAHLSEIGFLFTMGILAVFIITWVVGWIIRGILGIQQGSDVLPTPRASAALAIPPPAIPQPTQTDLIHKLEQIDAWCMETRNFLRYGDDEDCEFRRGLYGEFAALRQDVSELHKLLNPPPSR